MGGGNSRVRGREHRVLRHQLHAIRDATTQCDPPPPPDTACEHPDATWTDLAPEGPDIDCVPEDERAFPGQTAFFTEPIPDDLAPTGDLNAADVTYPALLIWDFNCDNEYTEQITSVNASCDPSCHGTQGWTSNVYPRCGGSATFQRRETEGLIIPVCEHGTAEWTQGCR